MKEYSINLDKERSLKFSNRSFMELEEITGKPVLSVFSEANLKPTPQEQQQYLISQFSTAKFATAFIYCGLLHTGMKYDEVVDIIPPSKYMEIMALAVLVITNEYGSQDKPAADGHKKKQRAG